MGVQGWWIMIAAVLPQQGALTSDNREWTELFCHWRTEKGFVYAGSWGQWVAQVDSSIHEVDLSGICEDPNSFYMSTSTPVKVRASSSVAKVSQRHSGWSDSIKSLKDCKEDRQCQKWTGAERFEEQSCARNFHAMCFHSLPSIPRLPAALGGCIALIQAYNFGSQFEVLPESEWD